MNVVLINPPLVSLKRDPFGNIPFIPIGICYLAGHLRKNNIDVTIVDAFGEKPLNKYRYKNFIARGLYLSEIITKIPKDVEVIGISVHSGMDYEITNDLMKLIRENNKDICIVIGGQYATIMPEIFIKNGADYVVLGEGEEPFLKLLNCLNNKEKVENIRGIISKKNSNLSYNIIENLDALPFPAYDLIKLNNYWDLKDAHGVTNGKYLPIISSRGCPYNCNFCASPMVCKKNWRGRSAKNIVDEIEKWFKDYNVRTFHIEDSNFAINKQRVNEICKEILKRSLKIKWSLPSGIKAETIDMNTLKIMKESGCVYFDIAPESGSKKILKKMNKPVDLDYTLKMVKYADSLKIKKGAFFILGYYNETKNDRKETRKYIGRLVKSGLDEITLFIFCPVPGSRDFKYFKQLGNFKNYEELCWSPRWRKDYKTLNLYRAYIYIYFYFIKLVYHPLNMTKSIFNILFNRYELKTEMAFKRIVFG